MDKNTPRDICRGACCYVSVFGKTNLDCAIAANSPYDNQRKSNQQKAQPFLAFLKMQDGVCNMDNLEQQPANPPKDAGFEFRNQKSNGANKINDYTGDNTN